MKQCHFFATAQSFLDPQFDKDGNLYAPIRYKEIVRECYIISKNCNTAYTDVLKMGYRERQHLLSFILEEAERLEQQQKEHQEQLRKMTHK